MPRITHAFVSGKSDGGDATLVRPSNWNAAHVGSSHALDSYAIDGTYGDDFTEASLNARWTRRNLASTNETYQDGPDQTHMTVDLSASGGGGGNTTSDRMYLETCPAGDWEIMVSGSLFIPDISVGGGASSTMYGPVAVSSTGTGVGFTLYHNGELALLTNLSSYAYASTLNSVNLNAIASHYPRGEKFWLKLKKVSGTYTGYWSLNGDVWSPVRNPTGTPSAFTPDRFGFGRFYVDSGGATDCRCSIDIFNKIA